MSEDQTRSVMPGAWAGEAVRFPLLRSRLWRPLLLLFGGIHAWELSQVSHGHEDVAVIKETTTLWNAKSRCSVSSGRRNGRWEPLGKSGHERGNGMVRGETNGVYSEPPD